MMVLQIILISEIQDDAVTTAKIPDSAVTNAAKNTVIVRDANSSIANDTQILISDGKLTMTNAGVVTIAINGSSVSLGGSATITGSELSAGDIFSNPNTISSDATFTTASTKNAFLKGDITVSGNAVMTIDGDGVLQLI